MEGIVVISSNGQWSRVEPIVKIWKIENILCVFDGNITHDFSLDSIMETRRYVIGGKHVSNSKYS